MLTAPEVVWEDDSSTIDWDELSQLYRIAPLGIKPPERLQRVFGNSRYMTFARHHGQLIAAGRVLSDGEDTAYICDMAVHPDYQGKGLGRTTLERLLVQCADHRKVMLFAAPGKNGFYRRSGFAPMKTAMARFINQDAARRAGLIE